MRDVGHIIRSVGMLMVAPAIEGVDLFKIVGRSISGWIPSLKTGTTIRQPFCSQDDLESSGRCSGTGTSAADLEQFTLSNLLPVALLPPDAAPILPAPLADTLESVPARDVTVVSSEPPRLVLGPTFDASTLPEPQREQFHRNLRAVELVLAGATQTSVSKKSGIPRSTLGRLVRRTKLLGQIACVPHGSYRGVTRLHPAFAECIRRLFLLSTRLSMTAMREHTEMQQIAARLSKTTGTTVKLPSYKQVRTAVQHLKMEPELVAMREGAKSVPRERSSAESFVLSIPALLTQVDEHTMDLYVVTPEGSTVASHVHAAMLICVKTAAILSAVLALGPFKEEDYMRLVKLSVERKDHLVGLNGCEHSWPCFGKPAIIFHDRGKIFTSERARSVLVDRLGIITEQAPSYAPSAKERKPNCTAKCSDDLSEDGCKPVWTGDASKGYESGSKT